MSASAAPRVLAVHASDVHGFSKFAQPAIHLLAGLGVEGDTHVMAIVLTGGEVRTGDNIHIELPAGEPRRLEPV